MNLLRSLLRSLVPGRRRAADQRGAVAVEAALMLGFVVIPLLLGVITYGSYFWQAQRVSPLSARLPMQTIVGEFTCQQLIDKVKTTVQNALPEVGGVTGVIPLESIGVSILNVLPTVGVTIELSVSIPVVTTFGSLLPLPNGGDVITEATYRLDNVVITSESC